MSTRPTDRDKAEAGLILNINEATSPEETASKQKHVRKCIIYTWDYHTSISIWNGLRTQPILADEVLTFKALILFHKVLQEGHPITIIEAHRQTSWLETCARTISGDGQKGYGALIRAYVDFILSKLRFHRAHPEFNGLFEYEEYVSLNGIDNPDQVYKTIADLMNLQDHIESFQKLIFAHLRPATTNECRISVLVPFVKESYGIYRFLTSMLRALHRRTNGSDPLGPLRQWYYTQHYSLLDFYYECSQLTYLSGMINVPELGQDPPNLAGGGNAAPNPPRSHTIARSLVDNEMIYERARGHEQQPELEQRAQDIIFNEQQQVPRIITSVHPNDPATVQIQESEKEITTMRDQYKRNKTLLEEYDQRVKTFQGQLTASEGQKQIWRIKYETLAKLYSQLRSDMLSELKKLRLKTKHYWAVFSAQSPFSH